MRNEIAHLTVYGKLISIQPVGRFTEVVKVNDDAVEIRTKNQGGHCSVTLIHKLKERFATDADTFIKDFDEQCQQLYAQLTKQYDAILGATDPRAQSFGEDHF